MMDQLVSKIIDCFGNIADHRGRNVTYSLKDLLSTAFAIFSLKDPSLLAFREAYPTRSQNLKRLYNIENIPEDTALRQGLDGVDPTELQQLFAPFIDQLQDHRVLQSRQVMEDYLTIAVDGTQHYCSSKQSCQYCLQKNHRGGGKNYYHQMLAGVLVHPHQRTVFPVGVEPIVKQDGSDKNDCELNAGRRLVPHIRQVLPKKNLLLVFDALYGNGPFISLLAQYEVNFMIVVKDGFVQLQAERLKEQGKLPAHTWEEGNVRHTARFANNLILNGQHQDIEVSYIEYEQINIHNGKQLYYNSWMTDIAVREDSVAELIDVGRARWKVENETFNTLKNQGYHLEHNYGHGLQHLATNFAILTMLAFLIDQIAQQLDKNFQKAMRVFKTRKAFWQSVREISRFLPVKSFKAIYLYICGEIRIDFPLLE